MLAVEKSTDEEVEMRKEKACYDVKRVVMARQEVVEEEDKDGGEGEGESESDEEDEEPLGCQRRHRGNVPRSKPGSACRSPRCQG